MDDITEETPSTARRSRSLLLRWAACTFLVAGVFVAARLTVHASDSADTARSATPLIPSNEPDVTEPPDTTEDPEAQPQMEGDADDLLAVFNGVLEDLLDDSTPYSDESGATATESSSTGWDNTGGLGASGGEWSMSYPAEWTVDEVSADITMFSAPDYPEVAVVMTRPYSGSLDDEASADLDQLLQGMPDGIVVSFDTIDVEGRDAIRAGLGYTNPDGQPAAVNVIWIHDGDTLYVIAGEAGVDQHELQATVDQALDSFTISEAV